MQSAIKPDACPLIFLALFFGTMNAFYLSDFEVALQSAACGHKRGDDSMVIVIKR
jgi:hypothetical protein